MPGRQGRSKSAIVERKLFVSLLRIDSLLSRCLVQTVMAILCRAALFRFNERQLLMHKGILAYFSVVTCLKVIAEVRGMPVQ